MSPWTFTCCAVITVLLASCSGDDEHPAPVADPSLEVPHGDDDESPVTPREEPEDAPVDEPAAGTSDPAMPEPDVEPSDEPATDPAAPTTSTPVDDAPSPEPEPEPTSASGGAGGSFTVGGSSGGGAGGSAPSMDAGAEPEPTLTGLLWPIDCIPDETCSLGYPDIDGDGVAFDCGSPGYAGHEGTDIAVTWEQMDTGVDVYAAAEGEVLFVFDGKYDRCPDDTQPDCAEAPAVEADNMDGVQVCTPLGPYCGTGEGYCFWCFWGGNVVVMRHEGLEGVFATRYDHLKRGSILVEPGDLVAPGQKIAEVGSAGNSTGPHLHFEVWTTGFYELGEPWVGECGPNTTASLWQSEPPW